ncbi:MAG: TIGR03936 family radical SAM-associated protein [Acidaminococcaceae bacterium]|nr:TIGR03936 family radical SAM-associated protein [Acidaminococcaceae bacterium]
MQLTKETGIRFISHLEYAHTLERALCRAKLPVAYSEGFNPHMKFSLASALGVGVASQAEFAEVELAVPELDVQQAQEAIAQNLPWGIQIKAVDLVESTANKLMASAAGASYEVIVPCHRQQESVLAAYNKAESVIYKKPLPKKKGQFKTVEVKSFVPSIKGVFLESHVTLTFDILITATGSMKAVEVLQILQEQFCLDIDLPEADIRRINIYRLDKKGRKLPMLSANNH